uniref:Uncharacterized protein n=1 Tax=Romanomermis culicivorax TaxID=13658 RepID=A0A915I9H2_ROMCU
MGNDPPKKISRDWYKLDDTELDNRKLDAERDEESCAILKVTPGTNLGCALCGGNLIEGAELKRQIFSNEHYEQLLFGPCPEREQISIFVLSQQIYKLL